MHFDSWVNRKTLQSQSYSSKVQSAPIGEKTSRLSHQSWTEDSVCTTHFFLCCTEDAKRTQMAADNADQDKIQVVAVLTQSRVLDVSDSLS